MQYRGLPLGNTLVWVAGDRLGPRRHVPRDRHPVRVVAGLQEVVQVVFGYLGTGTLTVISKSNL